MENLKMLRTEKQANAARITYAKKMMNNDSHILRGAWTDDGKQYLCNGYVMCEFLEILDDASTTERNAAEMGSLKKIVGSMHDYANATFTTSKPLEVAEIDFSELDTLRKEAKRQGVNPARIMVKIGGGVYAAENMQWLKVLCGELAIYQGAYPNNALSLFVGGDNGNIWMLGRAPRERDVVVAEYGAEKTINAGYKPAEKPKATPASQLRTAITDNVKAVKMRQKYASEAARENIKARPALAGAWFEKGKQCLCDGYSLMIFEDIIPELPQAMGTMHLDLQTILKEARAGALKIKVGSIDFDELEKVRKELRKQKKLDCEIVAKIGEYCYAVHYILMLQALTGKLKFAQDKSGKLVVDGINGVAMLLPVKKFDGYGREEKHNDAVADYSAAA